MIKIEQLNVQLGGNNLLESANLTVFDAQKVAIVGANGSGKSTLFRVLLNTLQPDGGSVYVPHSWRIGHMAQEVAESDRLAIDYVIDGDSKLREIEEKLLQADRTDNHEQVALLHAELDAIDGYQAKVRAERLLHGLGFSQPEISRPVSTFSGGWRIRLNLAQALMCPSDLLLLDEPTNHLDLDATLWLENWLKAYTGTLLFISHDRDFIDNVADNIVHIEHKSMNMYSGNYSAFERQRAEKLALQQQTYEKQQVRVAEIQDFVRRFKAKASKAKQAQSRLKELERMEKIAPAHIDSPFYFTFPTSEKISSPLINLDKATLGYPGKPIIHEANLSILPGTRWGLLGHNGAGKSTLIKSLTGQISLLSGNRHCGQHLAIGYFAQHQLEALDIHATALLHIQRLSPQAREQDIRTFLGSFGFVGDQALTPVDTFSGGQKARLALAIIAWQKPNLLLLDEPTNHLDLEVRHALTMAMQTFSGALIVVSHDRHLLKNTVDEYLLVHDGKITEFEGDLQDYEKWSAEENRRQEKSTTATEAEGTVSTTENRKEQKRQEAEKRKLVSPLRKKLEKLEKEMEVRQLKLTALEEKLSQADIYEAANKALLKSSMQEQTELKNELETIETDWFMLSEEIEAMLNS
ncbi:MAG: ATP-binding cassette domain-containing protein [Hahellaceae bacterium]|nr:ATP-binding cassette domain-containing protein [Hahellaceae bacterium]MCP5210131.1 ATP-binding cassette domain-containing protein [Hahellaceae bacterium]